MHRRLRISAILIGAITLGACSVESGGDGADTSASASAVPATPAPPPAAAPATMPDTQRADVSIEVDTKARMLHVMQGGQHVAQYRVAVGSAEWPTKTGEWTIGQVVWNPEWTPPPDESWADKEEPKEPGDPENPLGRVQLVYDPPRTIHGTNEPNSIGKAVSHGSIRMRNADAVALAKRLMEAGGAPKDSAFFQQVERNRKEKQIVDLPRRVPIVVK